MIQLTEDMRSSHQLISLPFAEWMERIAADPDSVTHINREGKNKYAFRFPMNAWPLLGDDRFKAEVVEATESVMHLCRIVPERVFGDNLQTMADMFDLPSAEVAEGMVRLPNGTEAAMARPDFLLTKDGFKCLETNTSPNLGGAFTNLWVDEYMNLPFVHAFTTEKSLHPKHDDPTNAFFQMLVDLTDGLREDGELTVGMCIDDLTNENTAGPLFNRVMAEYLTSVGIHDVTPNFVMALPYTDAAEPGQYETYVRDGKVYVDGKRIHLMLGDVKYQPEIMAAYRAGNVCMLNSPASYLMADKRYLALLSQHADRFTAEEQIMIDRFIPWSRLLVPGDTTYAGESGDLVTLLQDKQARFVLKRGQGLRGDQVVVGRKVSAQRWQEAIDAALEDGTWIAQEVQDSIPFLGMGEDRVPGPHQLVWGFFSYNAKYIGTFLRAQNLESGSGIVNSASGAIETVLLFL